jgi:hypothetical protein
MSAYGKTVSDLTTRFNSSQLYTRTTPILKKTLHRNERHLKGCQRECDQKT